MVIFIFIVVAIGSFIFIYSLDSGTKEETEGATGFLSDNEEMQFLKEMESNNFQDIHHSL